VAQELPRGIETVHARHAHVHENNIGPMLDVGCERVRSVFTLEHIVGHVAHCASNQSSYDWVVFHNQDRHSLLSVNYQIQIIESALSERNRYRYTCLVRNYTGIRVVPHGSSWVNLCSNALMLRVVTWIGCAAVSFDGPTLSLQQLPGSRWSLQQADNAVAGQDSHVTLQGDGTACVQRITLTDSNGKFSTVVFKAVANGGVDLQLPLTQYQAGATRLSFSSMERNDRTNLR
jgi:hypothetical protein